MYPERLPVTALAEWLHLAYLQDRHAQGDEVYPAERRAIAAHLAGQPERCRAVRAAWHAMLTPCARAGGDADRWLTTEFAGGGRGEASLPVKGRAEVAREPEGRWSPRVSGLLRRLGPRDLLRR